MSTRHSKAAEKFLQDSKMAAWHNETLWLVRAKRDKMSKEVPEWEELRNKACELKLYSNSTSKNFYWNLRRMPPPTEQSFIGRKMPMNIVPLSTRF